MPSKRSFQGVCRALDKINRIVRKEEKKQNVSIIIIAVVFIIVVVIIGKKERKEHPGPLQVLHWCPCLQTQLRLPSPGCLPAFKCRSMVGPTPGETVPIRTISAHFLGILY